MMKNGFMLLFIIAISYATIVEANAAILSVGPSDCSASTVNSAITSAADGDTVQLTCTGTVTWTSKVTIPSTKGITLQVLGGTNTPKSSANFPLTISAGSLSPVLTINIGQNNSVSRVSGFKFKNTAQASGVYIEIIGGGTGKSGLGSFRFDNNYLDSINAPYGIQVFRRSSVPLYGVIDNNTLHDLWYSGGGGIYGIMVWNYDSTGSPSCFGSSGWSDPFKFGDGNNVFIEDNAFENVTAGKYMRHYVSSELGGRYVVRHNSFKVTVADSSGAKTDLLDAHGLCLCYSNGCGGRGGESYANTFSGTQMSRVHNTRGGTWLIYDNVYNDTPGDTVQFQEYRAGVASDQSQCSSSCPCATTLGFTWIPSVGSNTSFYPLPQQVTGTYLWNNLVKGVNSCGSVDAGGVIRSYIKLDRDYFCSATKPTALGSYAPYTYPHPLITNVSTTPPQTVPPPAPENLSVR